MDITVFSIGLILLIVGGWLTNKNRFYKHKLSDMLFASELKIFFGGLILFISGILIIINEIKKVID